MTRLILTELATLAAIAGFLLALAIWCDLIAGIVH